MSGSSVHPGGQRPHRGAAPQLEHSRATEWVSVSLAALAGDNVPMTSAGPHVQLAVRVPEHEPARPADFAPALGPVAKPQMPWRAAAGVSSACHFELLVASHSPVCSDGLTFRRPSGRSASSRGPLTGRDQVGCLVPLAYEAGRRLCVQRIGGATWVGAHHRLAVLCRVRDHAARTADRAERPLRARLPSAVERALR